MSSFDEMKEIMEAVSDIEKEMVDVDKQLEALVAIRGELESQKEAMVAVLKEKANEL